MTSVSGHAINRGFAASGSVEAWRYHLLRAFDLLLMSVIFVAPLFMGGRGPVGRLVFAGMACLLAFTWAIRQCLEKHASWTRSGAEWLIVCGLSLAVLQLVPLPHWLSTLLSPATGGLLPLWTSEADPASRLGLWQQISFTPVATREGLAIYLAHAMLFTVVVQRIRSIQDIEQLLRWIALAAMGMAALGLAQLLLSNGKFFWIYEHPSRDTYRVIKGTFQNQNHFVHFLALGLGPTIWWLHRVITGEDSGAGSFVRQGRRSGVRGVLRRASGWAGSLSSTRQSASTMRHMLFVGLGILVFASLATFSRGGVIALLVAAAVSTAVFVRAGLLGKKSLVAIGGLTLLVASALLIHGYEPLAAKLSTLRDSRSLGELSQGRRDLWRAHAAAIPKFALFGTGIGSHREVYRTYLETHYDVEFTHGENGYLHLLLESGLAGLTCLLSGIVIGLTWCFRTLRGSRGQAPPTRYLTCAGVILAGLLASVVHSFGDFVWYIPACMSLAMILLACACRLDQLRRTSTTSSRSPEAPDAGLHSPCLPRPAWCAMAVCLVAVGFGMFRDLVPAALAAPHWDAQLRLADDSGTRTMEDQGVAAQLASMSWHLERVLQYHADDARANLRMAAVLLHQFELRQKVSLNPMSLSQVRDAALASRFPTREAQDAWLDVAVGENRRLLDRALFHARRAVQLCPLQGDGYVYLAELTFLNNPQDAAKEAYVAQAERVRPYSGLVQFAVGKEAALAGDSSKALAYWKKAFHQDPEVQWLIIDTLGPHVPAPVFLSEFAPDSVGLSRLYSYFLTHNRLDDARTIGEQYVRVLIERAGAAEQPAAAAGQWHQARMVYDFLGDLPQAADCEQRAVALTPDDFGKRRELASLLLRLERYDEAVQQLQWCLRRKPDDSRLEQMISEANRHRLDTDSLPADEVSQRPTARH